jgi:hypothetical protein
MDGIRKERDVILPPVSSRLDHLGLACENRVHRMPTGLTELYGTHRIPYTPLSGEEGVQPINPVLYGSSNRKTSQPTRVSPEWLWSGWSAAVIRPLNSCQAAWVLNPVLETPTHRSRPHSVRPEHLLASEPMLCSSWLDLSPTECWPPIGRQPQSSRISVT